MSAASRVVRARRWQPTRASRSCLRSREGEVRELLVSTKKGLFALEGDVRFGFELRARAFAGVPVEYALRDRRSGWLVATTTSPFYGPKIFLPATAPQGGGRHAVLSCPPAVSRRSSGSG